MAFIKIRIDDGLEARAHLELEKLGVTPSERTSHALQYAGEHGQLTFKPVLMTQNDEALMETVGERLASPQRVRVFIRDL